MKITLKDAAQIAGGTVAGDENLVIENISKIEDSKPGDLTFLYLPAYEKYYPDTKASAIIVKPGFNRTRDDISYIIADNPNAALLKIIQHYFRPEFSLTGIDPTAYIAPSARIGRNVAIGRNVVVSEGCSIGDNTKIYHNTVLLDGVQTGSDCLIFQNVSIRENCILGSRVIVHAGTVIGSDGFGYAPDSKGGYIKIPQIGNVVIEDDVELGSNVSIDRASIGSTLIKKGAKIDNLVQIAHNVTVGENTVMSAQTGVSGSTHVGSSCILAGQVGIAGHLEIADNVIIAAKSGVSKSLVKPGMYFGIPVKEHKTALKLEALVRNLPQFAQKIKDLEAQVATLQEKLDKAGKDL